MNIGIGLNNFWGKLAIAKIDDCSITIDDKSFPNFLIQIGLPDPVYNNNTFIFKTTVLSASFEHESTQNARIGDENVRIETTVSWLKAKIAWPFTRSISWFL